jgi:hypothetical protein
MSFLVGPVGTVSKLVGTTENVSRFVDFQIPTQERGNNAANFLSSEGYSCFAGPAVL